MQKGKNYDCDAKTLLDRLLEYIDGSQNYCCLYVGGVPNID